MPLCARCRHRKAESPALRLRLLRESCPPPALLHILEMSGCFREAEASLSQTVLALSPLQTPSADLFHYDSMNAVNWGMRGEQGPG